MFFFVVLFNKQLVVYVTALATVMSLMLPSSILQPALSEAVHI